MARSLTPLVLISLIAGGAVLGLYPQVSQELSELGGPRPAMAQSPATNRVPDYGRPQGAPTAPAAAVRPSEWPSGQATSAPVARTASLTPAGPPYPSAITPGISSTNAIPGAAGPTVAARNLAPGAQATTGLGPNPILQPGYKFQGQEILARVGTELVQASELLPAVDDILSQNADKIPPEELDKVRLMLLRQRLTQLINTKLVVATAKHGIPSENLPKIKEKVDEHFERTQLKKMIEGAGVNSKTELDAKLRTMGSSLEATRQAFFDRSLAQQWVQQHVKEDEEITHQEMLTYYRDHAAEYELEAKARFEHIRVTFANHPDKQAAYAAIALQGNRLLGGAKFSDIAKTASDDATASDGGLHDWTTKGSLVSEPLDEAIFSLPVGRLSKIIEDDNAFHIVRVLERKDAGKQPFVEAQAGIKKKISEERKAAESKAYLEKLRKETPVWTVFDELPAS